MMGMNGFQDYKFNQRTFRLVSYSLICLMIAAGGHTLATFNHMINLNWEMWYLPGVFSLVAVERFLMHRRFKEYSSEPRDWFLLLGAQWVLIMLVVKAVVLLSMGGEAALAEMQSLLKNPQGLFFDAQFLTVFFLSITVWMECGILADLLDEIGLELDRFVPDRAAPQPPDWPSARQRFSSHIISMGFILVMFTGLMRIDLRKALSTAVQIKPTQLSFFEAGGGSTLLYFVFGMALFSQVHLIQLLARWRAMQIPISRNLVRNWAYCSLLFLLLLAIGVVFMPTQFSLGFIETLGHILYFIFFLLATILQLLWLLLAFLMSLPFLLFSKTPLSVPLPRIPPLHERLAQPDFAAPATPMDELLKSLLFWGVFLVVIIFAIVQFARQHEDVAQTLREYAIVRRLIQFWDWLMRIFKGTGQRMSTAMRSGIRWITSPGKEGSPGLIQRFLNLRGLNSRQRVIFYFLAMIRRAGEQGLPRAGSQTPYEYTDSLGDAFPDAVEDIASMSASFVEARYSQHPVSAEKVSKVKEYWQRIRQALRKIRE